MGKLPGSKDRMEPCIVCKQNQPQGKYSDVPVHLTCGYDEAGKKKIIVWKREQKKLAKSEMPTFDLPD